LASSVPHQLCCLVPEGRRPSRCRGCYSQVERDGQARRSGQHALPSLDADPQRVMARKEAAARWSLGHSVQEELGPQSSVPASHAQGSCRGAGLRHVRGAGGLGEVIRQHALNSPLQGSGSQELAEEGGGCMHLHPRSTPSPQAGKPPGMATQTFLRTVCRMRPG